MDIYNETILDHYHNPHHASPITSPTHMAAATNPLCGDMLTVEARIEKDIVQDIGFIGNGCAISQAAMSMLADEVIGKKITAIKKLKPRYIYNMLGIHISPGRTKCALLGLHALQHILPYEKK